MRPCRSCGKEITIRKQGVRYCSDECNPNHRVCKLETCTESFLSYEGRDFCCREHRSEYFKNNGVHKPGTHPPRDCKKCSKSFDPGTNLQLYCSPQCRPTWGQCLAEGCHEEFDRGAEAGSDRKFCREHVRVVNSVPKGYKQRRDWVMKRMTAPGVLKPSREELSLIPTLESYGFSHTGAGAFWRTWQDGTIHCPDFVNFEEKVIFEYFGDYYHRDDIGKETEIAQAWEEIGYGCIILWSPQREAFLDNPEEYLVKIQTQRETFEALVPERFSVLDGANNGKEIKDMMHDDNEPTPGRG